MYLRENVNRIHNELSDNFDSVYIKELNNLEYGNYIELSVSESNKKLIAIIKKSELDNVNFNWSYKANPNSDYSHMVERSSSIDSFFKDVKDIFDKNRFDSRYIK